MATINKPKDYDTTPEQGEFTAPAPGGHRMIIHQVLRTESRDGRPMLKIDFDFDPTDSQPKLFENEYRNDIRPEKKWPRGGTQYVMQYTADGGTSRGYKTFCSCAEKSNQGYKIPWGSEQKVWESSFKGKKIGGVFGMVENFYNGKMTTRSELRWFCQYDKAADASIPDLKQLSEDQKRAAANWKAAETAKEETGFMNIPDDVADEGLPFN